MLSLYGLYAAADISLTVLYEESLDALRYLSVFEVMSTLSLAVWTQAIAAILWQSMPIPGLSWNQHRTRGHAASGALSIGRWATWMMQFSIQP